MKKTTIIIALILSSFAGFSQTKIVRDANGNFVTQKAPKKASEDKATGQTFLTAKGEEFPVYQSEKGKYYVIRTSKETGNQYKQYLKIED